MIYLYENDANNLSLPSIAPQIIHILTTSRSTFTINQYLLSYTIVYLYMLFPIPTFVKGILILD